MVRSFIWGFIAVAFVALWLRGRSKNAHRRDDDEDTRETDEEYLARMRFQDFSEGEHSPVTVDLDNDR